MPNIEYRPGVDTNLRIYKHGQQIGLIIDMGKAWRVLAEHQFYEAETLREIAAKLDDLNGKKGAAP